MPDLSTMLESVANAKTAADCTVDSRVAYSQKKNLKKSKRGGKRTPGSSLTSSVEDMNMSIKERDGKAHDVDSALQSIGAQDTRTKKDGTLIRSGTSVDVASSVEEMNMSITNRYGKVSGVESGIQSIRTLKDGTPIRSSNRNRGKR